MEQKYYYILFKNNKGITQVPRDDFAPSKAQPKNLIKYFSFLVDSSIQKISIEKYVEKEWFRTKKVAIAYCQFLIEKQALELAKKAEKLRQCKITLINATNGEQQSMYDLWP